jgi:hypothetical protein
MWYQHSPYWLLSGVLLGLATLACETRAGDEKVQPLPVSYTSVGDTIVLQSTNGDHPWIRLIGVGTLSPLTRACQMSSKGSPFPRFSTDGLAEFL